MGLVQPLRLGLKWTPPTLGLEYTLKEDSAEEKESTQPHSTNSETMLLEVPLSSLYQDGGVPEVDGALVSLQDKHRQYFSPSLVSARQLRRLMWMLISAANKGIEEPDEKSGAVKKGGRDEEEEEEEVEEIDEAGDLSKEVEQSEEGDWDEEEPPPPPAPAPAAYAAASAPATARMNSMKIEPEITEEDQSESPLEQQLEPQADDPSKKSSATKQMDDVDSLLAELEMDGLHDKENVPEVVSVPPAKKEELVKSAQPEDSDGSDTDAASASSLHSRKDNAEDVQGKDCGLSDLPPLSLSGSHPVSSLPGQPVLEPHQQSLAPNRKMARLSAGARERQVKMDPQQAKGPTTNQSDHEEEAGTGPSAGTEGAAAAADEAMESSMDEEIEDEEFSFEGNSEDGSGESDYF